MGAAPNHKVSKESRERVTAYAETGLTVQQIADALKINYNTVIKYYKLDIETGRANGLGRVASKVFRQAIEGCRQSQKLYLAQVGGWSDKVKISGDPDAPIVHEHKHSLDMDAAKEIGMLMQQLATQKSKGIIDGEAVPVPRGPDPAIMRLVGTIRSGDSDL